VNASLIAMAQSSCKRICCIGSRNTSQLQDRHHHVLHLFFGCSTSPDNRLLYLARRVFINLDTVLECGAYRGRTRMSKFQSAACVLVHKDALNYDDIGLELFDDAADGIEYLPESVRKSAILALHSAAGHINRCVTTKVEHPEAGQARPWINTQYSLLIGQWPSQS